MNENVMPDSTVVDSVVAKVLNPEMVANGNYQDVLSFLWEKGLDLLLSLGTRIVLAIVVFFIGRWIINRLKSIFAKMLERRSVEISLASFLKSLVNVVLTFFLIVSIIGILGIETSSFVALFASAGVAIGMALSGTLQNFAGGVMILLFKPFKVGDFVEAQGVVGVVKEIQIFNTIFNTLDNKVVIVPNGGLSTGIVTNYSKEENRRVDWVFSIAYGDDYQKAKSIIEGMLAADARVLKDPAPFVALSKLNSSSVDLTVRAWVLAADYWDVFFSMNEKVYETFRSQGLNIPFPQMDVHLHQK
ncbi:MAG: mechanosensitive ion channel [Paludibacteraceae bacterium]|nr:mechanosensitive ion channel [Paludibacteraceae bacterium]